MTPVTDFHWVQVASLSALVVAAVTTDLRHRTIPNRLLALGLGMALITATAMEDAPGLVAALVGGVTAALALLPMYAIGAMGAGDVKLMGVAGTFLGSTALIAALYSLVAGLVLALAVGWGSGRKGHIPYAPAIAAGVLGSLWTGSGTWS